MHDERRSMAFRVDWEARIATFEIPRVPCGLQLESLQLNQESLQMNQESLQLNQESLQLNRSARFHEPPSLPAGNITVHPGHAEVALP